MIAKKSIFLILNFKSYPIPFKFQGLTDVSEEVNSMILEGPEHQYNVRSNVSVDIF